MDVFERSVLRLLATVATANEDEQHAA
jgi:hypothetical protein